MKTRHKKKLVFKKTVVSTLDKTSMQRINGGGSISGLTNNSNTGGISMQGTGNNTMTKTGTLV